MNEKKQIQDETKEEYSFMQEVIKDEKIDGQKIKKNIFHMIAYGMIFGAVASLVFGLSFPWIKNHMGVEKVRVEIPKDDETETEEEQPKEPEVTEVKNVMDQDGYRQVVQSLGVTASKQRKCIVTLDITKANQEKLIDEYAGFVLADNGQELLIVGNALKLKDDEEVWVTFYDGNMYKAAQRLCEFNLGIGVYAISKDEIEDSVLKNVEIATLGNSNIIETGEVVIAMGKPFGTDNAAAYGVVAPDEEKIELADGSYRLLSTNIVTEENGSGVIFNEKGRVIGLIAPEAIPDGSKGRIGGYGISGVKEIMELLSNGSSIPYIGIFGMDVSEKMIEKHVPEGIYVKAVEADSPAMAAGIQSGDVIRVMDGKEIKSWEEYHQLLMQKKENDKIKIQGYRQGATDSYVDMEYEITIGSKNKK